MNCKNCRFWEELNEYTQMGDCKIKPPKHRFVEGDPYVPNDHGRDSCVFPVTHKDDWCGEFKYPLEHYNATGMAIIQEICDGCSKVSTHKCSPTHPSEGRCDEKI